MIFEQRPDLRGGASKPWGREFQQALDLLGDQEEELGVLKHLRVSRKDVTLSHLCFSKFFLLAVWSMDTGRRRGGCRSNPGKRGQERIGLNQITAM